MKNFLFRKKFPFSFFEKFGEMTNRIELLDYALKASRVNEFVNNFNDKRVWQFFHELDLIFKILLLFYLVSFKLFLWNFYCELCVITLPCSFIHNTETAFANFILFATLIVKGIVALFGLPIIVKFVLILKKMIKDLILIRMLLNIMAADSNPSVKSNRI
jgi:hypothetical protein